MKISEPVFDTSINFITGCSEKVFDRRWNTNNSDSDERGTVGKTLTGAGEDVWIWIHRKDDIETLVHELSHAIRFLLQDEKEIMFSRETDEVYAYLLSSYTREYLKRIGLKRLTYEHI